MRWQNPNSATIRTSSKVCCPELSPDSYGDLSAVRAPALTGKAIWTQINSPQMLTCRGRERK